MTPRSAAPPPGAAALPHPFAGAEQVCVLSPGQERLRVLHALEPGPRYNVPRAFVLRGALDAKALGGALEAVAARHPALRTTFAEVDGAARQVVWPAGRWPVAPRVEDVDAAGAEAIVRSEARAVFDLGAAPPWRCRVLRTGPDEHVLLLTLHHIVTDGGSLAMLTRELAACYSALATHRPVPDLPAAGSYAAFAARQREELAAGRFDAPLAHWRERLHALPSAIDAPPAAAPAAGPDAVDARRTLCLPDDLLDAVRRLARGLGVSRFTVLLAAFAAVLARRASRRALGMATVMAGRTRPELLRTCGFFVNLVPLEVGFEGDPDFATLAARVDAAVRAAREDEEVPFEALLDGGDPAARAARERLLSVVFAMQNPGTRANLSGLHGLEARMLEIVSVGPKFGLSCTVDEPAVHLEYRPGVLAGEEVEGLGRAYVQALREVTADPSVRVERVRLADEGARREALALARGGQADEADAAAAPAGWRSVVSRVWEQAAREPDAVAVVGAGGEAVRYGELAREAESLAEALRGRGVGAEARVALALGGGPRWIAAALGVMRAGAAYVALDPGSPPARLGRMLRDCGAAAVVADAGTDPGLLAGLSAPVLRMDELGPARGGAAWPDAEPEQAAYVVYTSGSTGEPKGVVCTHRGLAALAEWTIGAFGLAAGERTTQVAGLGFDVAEMEVWSALAAGCEVRVPPEAARYGAEPLREWLLASGARVSFVPTPLAEPLVRMRWPEETPLRTLYTGGDRLHRHPPAGLPFRLVNIYGPAEGTVVASSGTVPAAEGEERGGAAPSIGRPLPYAHTYVLDAALEPVPAGVAGELWLGGAGVGRGYLGRAGMTAERFVPDPFSPAAGARMYRTGDRARWRTDGELEFMGRDDGQVKVRGQRIELAEVERAVRAAPGVREAAVVLHGGESPRLVAWVVAEDGAGEMERAVRAAVRTRLPEAMVPARVGTVATLPLTLNGKVDRGALQALGLPVEPPPAGADPPRTDAERRVADGVASVLERAGVERDEDFFALGGHSLAAMRLVALLRSEHGLELSLNEVFEGRTVAAMAAAAVPVEEADDGGEDADAASGAAVALVECAGRSTSPEPEPRTWR